MNYLKVENKDGLVRDCETNAILNVDVESYNQYIKNYHNKIKENEKMNQIESEVIKIKDDLNEIKNLLRSIFDESK